MPRSEIPLMVDRLVAGWSAYPFCAVICPAGLRFRAVDPNTTSALLAQIGYHQRVGEWFRLVALRATHIQRPRLPTSDGQPVS
eukprot:10011422-Alexandrium_andersonii.AAC.1